MFVNCTTHAYDSVKVCWPFLSHYNEQDAQTGLQASGWIGWLVFVHRGARGFQLVIISEARSQI